MAVLINTVASLSQDEVMAKYYNRKVVSGMRTFEPILGAKQKEMREKTEMIKFLCGELKAAE